MRHYDWILVGNGITGAALSYELAKLGLSVLLVEQSSHPANATRYSYGGIAYWSATTSLMKQFCQEGIDIHRDLSAELDGETQFRELDLVLPILAGRDPTSVAASYAHFATPPRLISPKEACEVEPLLNREAIAAALTVRHGHVSPEKMVAAYNQAFLRLGGTIEIAAVTGLVRTNHRVSGVLTPAETWTGANVILCTGGLTRSFLRAEDIQVRTYFTQAEIIETVPLDLHLSTILMPAELKRFEMQARASQADKDPLWDEPGHEVVDPILDAGAVQFLDGRVRIGQMSRALTDPAQQVDPVASEAKMRSAIASLLPALQDVPGHWCSCLVGFSPDRLPLVGAIAGLEGLHVFSGFGNPFAILPAVARRFAAVAAGSSDELIDQLSPNRFKVSVPE